MTGWRQLSEAEWQARPARTNRGWLDAVAALLIFEVLFMSAIAGLTFAGQLTSAELLHIEVPDPVEMVRWFIWFTAPFILLLFFVKRYRHYPALYLAISLAEHGAVYIPDLIWPLAEPRGGFLQLLLILFTVFDILIVWFLFTGQQPRLVFCREVPEGTTAP